MSDALRQPSTAWGWVLNDEKIMLADEMCVESVPNDPQSPGRIHVTCFGKLKPLKVGTTL